MFRDLAPFQGTGILPADSCVMLKAGRVGNLCHALIIHKTLAEATLVEVCAKDIGGKGWRLPGARLQQRQ